MTSPSPSPPPSSSRTIPLVLLRHGRSEWNLQNRFTGWEDIPLSPQGESDARRAGALLRGRGFTFDFAACSLLKRAIATMWIVQEETDLMWLPTLPDWRLNERHYGALQGRDKREAEAEHGGEKIREWRRGYNARPPLLEVATAPPDHRYAGITPPLGESLSEARIRVSAFYDEAVVPRLSRGMRPLIVAHGNILRALTMRIENADTSGENIASLEIPTGAPLVYELDANLHPLSRKFLD